MCCFLTATPQVPVQLCLRTAHAHTAPVDKTSLSWGWGGRKDRWSVITKTHDIIWHCLLMVFTYFMQQICLLSCYLNIDTLLNIAYGRLLFQGKSEAGNLEENFNSDVFMINICINGYVCSYFSYCDFHIPFIVSLSPIIF